METRRKKLQNIEFTKKANLGLWLDKFITGQDTGKNSGEKFKTTLVNQAKEITVSADYEKIFNRRQESLAEIEPNIFKAIEIDSRMIVGLGGESVWENGISIHRTYGVPFIPGSALKGLAASYARKSLKDFDEHDKAYKFIFGSPKSAGFITFHDALLTPESAKTQFLHADIMTVHHQDYYNDGKKPPADWDSPVPINFISASGTYLLALTTVEDGEKWLEITAEILKQTFKSEGIGAKTSSGYGRATLTDNFPKTEKMKALEKQRKQLEEEKQEAEIERQAEETRLAEEKLQEEKRLAYEAEQQAAAELKQKHESSKIQRTSEQIEKISANTKKIQKELKNISNQIYKIENAEQKQQLAAAALEKIGQLQSENVKIDVSGKWFVILKKLRGLN